jgi:hypothetical protein
MLLAHNYLIVARLAQFFQADFARYSLEGFSLYKALFKPA